MHILSILEGQPLHLAFLSFICFINYDGLYIFDILNKNDKRYLGSSFHSVMMLIEGHM